jgi:hypothetical protein
VTWAGGLRRAISAAAAAASPGCTAADLDRTIGPLLTGMPPGASPVVRWVDQADMATHGEYAGDLAPAPGAVAVISIEVRFADGTYATVAETVQVSDAGAVCLTGSEPRTYCAGPPAPAVGVRAPRAPT